MASDFESFLKVTASTKVADDYGDLLATLFEPLDRPETEAELEEAEQRIGTSLPAGYKTFLRILGPGSWCDAGVVTPADEVFSLDETCWQMAGFVSIVHNVRGVGDHLAFDPKDGERNGERPLYYCGHDPFGYARVSDSFEEWARSAAAAMASEEDMYAQFDEAVWAKWEEYKAAQPKRWWQFWR